MFTRSIIIQRRVEDFQLGVKSYQKKLNLTKLLTLIQKDSFIRIKTSRTGYSDEVSASGDLEKSDKERAAAMIQAIDKQLKTRRIMRSLEKFVGGKLYEGDFRMLQQTI
nr:hypothetical protein [Tanacetum cinerariifolium]